MIDILETPGLTLSDPILSNDNIFVTINGTRYIYTVKDESELSPKDVVKKVMGMKKFSDGKALAFLKKHCDGKRYEVASYDNLNETTEDSGYTKDRAIRVAVTECFTECIHEILDLMNIEDDDNTLLLRIAHDDKVVRLKRDLMKVLSEFF